MTVQYLEGSGCLSALQEIPSASQDLIVLSTGALIEAPHALSARLWEYLDECTRLLREGGLLFVQGRPDTLPEVGVYLDQRLRFRFVDGGGWLARKRDLKRLVENRYYVLNLQHLDMLEAMVLQHVPAQYFQPPLLSSP